MDWVIGDTFNSTQYTARTDIDLNSQVLKYCIIATDYFGNQTVSNLKTINIINDVAIAATPSKTVRSQGGNLTLNVTVSNKGSLPLDFLSFNVYVNSIPYNAVLDTQGLYVLQNGTSTTVSLIFNTSALPKTSYMLAAYTPYFPGEKNATNNSWLRSLVITIMGDFSGDFKVGPADFAYLSASYGSTPGQPNWNSNCDANDDQKIGPADFALLSANYGKHYP
jgi:hypothetical protein